MYSEIKIFTETGEKLYIRKHGYNNWQQNKSINNLCILFQGFQLYVC